MERIEQEMENRQMYDELSRLHSSSSQHHPHQPHHFRKSKRSKRVMEEFDPVSFYKIRDLKQYETFAYPNSYILLDNIQTLDLSYHFKY